MSSFEINRAVRVNTPAFIALAGPSGSGKTRSGLELALGLAGDGRVLLADTEGNRALHYADLYKFDHVEFRPPYTPERCAELIDLAEEQGYSVLIVDSGSDEFEGEGGLQEIREATKDEFWAKTKARHKHALINRIRRARVHVIFCLRCEERVRISKVDGRTVVEPLGWQPICEKRFLYEMQSSLRFDPERPGIPVPIKLYDIHAKFFPKDKMITREAGRRLAEWASGGAIAVEPKPEDDEAFLRIAEANADRGVEAFRAWWKTLSEGNRDLLRARLGDLQNRATKADASHNGADDQETREVAEEDSLGLRPLADEPASPDDQAEAAEAEAESPQPPTASADPIDGAQPAPIVANPAKPTPWERRAMAILEDFVVDLDKRQFRTRRSGEIKLVHDNAPRVWGRLLDHMNAVQRDEVEEEA